MTTSSASPATLPVQHTDRFFIGGQWVTPSSDSTITVIDSRTEQDYLTVAEAQAPDMDRAIAAAREAFDRGPWPRLTHAERAGYLRALGDEVLKRSGAIQQMWPREAGVLASMAGGAAFGAKHTFEYYADLAGTFEWERPVRPARGGFGLVVKEPVGVVGAIIPWNASIGLISMKLAPALLARCTVILKSSPEAPGEGYVIAEAAEAAGLPARCSRHSRPLSARSGSAIRSTRRRRWGRWPPSGSGTGSRATSPRASRSARRWPPAAAGRRASTAAGTSSPPYSATWTTSR